MSIAKFASMLALSLALLLIAAASCFAVMVGSVAPDFRLAGVSGSDTVQLSQYFDKPTVLVFWASWCPHCQKELPTIQALCENLKDKIHVVGVNLDNKKATAASYVSAHLITFPNASAGGDSSADLLAKYEISGVPAVFVIDKGGTIQASHSGEVTKEIIMKELDALGVK